MFSRKPPGSRPAASSAPPPPVVPARAGTAPRSGRTDPATLAPGQLAYETRRARKAGMGLDKWMAEKDRRARAEQEAVEAARRKAQPPARPGLLRRLLDRAHRPF